MAAVGSLTDLAKFRDPNQPRDEKTIVADPRFPGKDIRLLAFDQTLVNCGMVDITTVEGRPIITATQTLRTPQFATRGHELNLDRSVVMQDLVMANINRAREAGDIDVIVYETPPVANRMARPESSLLGAHCVRYTAYKYGILTVSISAQKAKTTIAGFAKADKKAAHEALKRRYSVLQGYPLLRNEHERDALMLAITYLIERRR